MMLLALLSGALVGAILGLIGGGGSILALPLLVYVVGYEGDPHVAIGTTALAVAVSALANLLQHRRHGHVHMRAGLWFALPGVLGALVGARLGLATPGDKLLFLFALLMLVVAWRLWKEPAPEPYRSVPRTPRLRRHRVALGGVGVGLLSGFFGIGGGFLVVPALMWTARLSMREAIGTSLLAVAAFGLATAGRYGIAGQVDLGMSAVFIVGGLVGGALGTLASRRLPKRALRRGFAALLPVVALYMLFRSLAAFGGLPSV